MSWFYEPPRPVETRHNGVMSLHRFLGKWKLKGHDGTEQATPYMDALWHKVLRACAARGHRASRCLILGVGMGATFGVVRHRFPGCRVVGVDWEPELFVLGVDLGVCGPTPGVEFVEGDAATVVPELDGPFDLVIVDLFDGRKVADAVSDPGLQDAVCAKLSPGAAVCVNGFDQPGVFEGWRARLEEGQPVRYQGNRIGMFRVSAPAASSQAG